MCMGRGEKRTDERHSGIDLPDSGYLVDGIIERPHVHDEPLWLLRLHSCQEKKGMHLDTKREK